MDDQWPFVDDFTVADDWFLSQQPFWAAVIHPALPDGQGASKQSGMPAQVIEPCTNENLDMWTAEGSRDLDALSTCHAYGPTTLSLSDQAPAAVHANFPGFGTPQNLPPAEKAVDCGAHAVVSPSQTQHNALNNFQGRSVSGSNPKRETTYLRSTCATCEAPLDTSELVLHIESPQLLCTRNKAPDHLPLYCLHTGCGLKFKDLDALREHSELSSHVSVQCGVPGCITSLCMSAVDDHYAAIHQNLRYHCAECNGAETNEGALSGHGSALKHAAFICEYPGCNSTAATSWDIQRHELKHRKDVLGYPCPRCPRYQGRNSFKRKDHLQQHMRNFHLVIDTPIIRRRGLFSCKFFNCRYIGRPSSLARLATHMLEVHQSMPYICDESGCFRTGMNGFENHQLLKLHSKNDHVSPYQCKQSGCDRVCNNGWKRKTDAIKHMKKHHEVVELYEKETAEYQSRALVYMTG